MKNSSQYPTTKKIIYLLGLGTLLMASVVMPGLGIAAGQIYRAKRKHDCQESQKAWKKFNPYLLKRNLKRLQQQKIVEIINQNGEEIIKLSDHGNTKYLKFKLEELSLKGSVWDHKWRLVIYDVNKLKRLQQEQFRRIIKQMRFLMLQKSVYLTPFQCKNEISYLREYFNLSEEVIIIEVNKLENEQYYKTYFGI